MLRYISVKGALLFRQTSQRLRLLVYEYYKLPIFHAKKTEIKNKHDNIFKNHIKLSIDDIKFDKILPIYTYKLEYMTRCWLQEHTVYITKQTHPNGVTTWSLFGWGLSSIHTPHKRIIMNLPILYLRSLDTLLQVDDNINCEMFVKDDFPVCFRVKTSLLTWDFSTEEQPYVLL